MMRGCWLALVLLAASKQSGALNNLDNGLQWSFVRVEMDSGDVYTGQVVGVYNEAKFMWNPSEFSRAVLFTCSNFYTDIGDFSVLPGQDPAIFSLSTSNIVTISMVPRPDGLEEYQLYMRLHGHVFSYTPVEGETWISRAWDSYHTWEDGRGNYAWDIGALNTNMMSYTGYGTNNNQYAVWGKNVQLPMAGKVITAVEKEVDNIPDMTAAVDMEDVAEGEDVGLEELPQNLVELKVGGDNSQFMLRLIHLTQWSIPNQIRVGNTYPAGTLVGTVGNSGTTLVPHLHAVWGFNDLENRFWSLPIEWKAVTQRKLLAYPTGYQYGQDHPHDYFYPKYGNLIKN